MTTNNTNTTKKTTRKNTAAALPYITESEPYDITKQSVLGTDNHEAHLQSRDILPDDADRRQNVGDLDARERTAANNRKYRYPWPLGRQMAHVTGYCVDIPEEPSQYDPSIMVGEHDEIEWTNADGQKVIQKIFPSALPSFKRAINKRTRSDLCVKNPAEGFTEDGRQSPEDIDKERVYRYLMRHPIEVNYDFYTDRNGKQSNYPSVQLFFPEDRVNQPMRRNWVRA